MLIYLMTKLKFVQCKNPKKIFKFWGKFFITGGYNSSVKALN